MPNFQMHTDEKSKKSHLTGGSNIHFTHWGYQLISCTDCKLLVSGGCLLFNHQISVPEQPSDSLSIDTGGFGIRETTFITPLQRTCKNQNAVSSIIWNWFCWFLWHPFLWIGLLFLTFNWAPCRNKVSTWKWEVFLILYGTHKKWVFV